MSKVYNVIGSLSALKCRLEESNIDDFKSLKEVIDFRSDYPFKRQQILTYYEDHLKQEQDRLKLELDGLANEINLKRRQTEDLLTVELDNLREQLNRLRDDKSKNFFQSLVHKIIQWKVQKQIRTKEHSFDESIEASVAELLDVKHAKSSRYRYLCEDFTIAVERSAQAILSEIDRKKRIIDDLSSFIYGALGEQKVVKVLESLPDEYVLINDFSVTLSPPMYNKQENDYIKSIQIDHLLIAPSGIFVIETKNWSQKSLEDIRLRSPVEQIRRSSYVLYRLLNNQFGGVQLDLDKHHWGDKRVSIKNLIVLIGAKPNEEFQYVKVLTINELLRYITYFKPVYKAHEIERIADFLLNVSRRKRIITK